MFRFIEQRREALPNRVWKLFSWVFPPIFLPLPDGGPTNLPIGADSDPWKAPLLPCCDREGIDSNRGNLPGPEAATPGWRFPFSVPVTITGRLIPGWNFSSPIPLPGRRSPGRHFPVLRTSPVHHRCAPPFIQSGIAPISRTSLIGPLGSPFFSTRGRPKGRIPSETVEFSTATAGRARVGKSTWWFLIPGAEEGKDAGAASFAKASAPPTVPSCFLTKPSVSLLVLWK